MEPKAVLYEETLRAAFTENGIISPVGISFFHCLS